MAMERYFGEVDPETHLKENLGMTLVPDQNMVEEFMIHHGKYQNSRFHGLGCAYSPKFKYTGYFKRGIKHGKGQFLRFDTKESYIGEFKNNHVYGFGVIKRGLASEGGSVMPKHNQTDPIERKNSKGETAHKGVSHYVVTGYFNQTFYPSGFGSIVKLQNNRVFKGFLEDGIPSKIGSFFKNGILVYTGEFGAIDSKNNLNIYKDN
jgi:hypothetical protein